MSTPPPPEYIYPETPPPPKVVDREVKVEYAGANPNPPTIWGPMTQGSAEEMSIKFAGSPQVVATVTIQKAGTGA